MYLRYNMRGSTKLSMMLSLHLLIFNIVRFKTNFVQMLNINLRSKQEKVMFYCTPILYHPYKFHTCKSILWHYAHVVKIWKGYVLTELNDVFRLTIHFKIKTVKIIFKWAKNTFMANILEQLDCKNIALNF